MPGADARGQAVAGSILTIDLAAIVDNYRLLAAKAAPAQCAAVVKADAYGLGAARVAPALWRAGCRTFFVALYAEGVALRRMLPKAVVYVLNGFHTADPEPYIADRLRPVLASLDQIDRWRKSVDRRRGGAAGLHLDTGMARLGLPFDEMSILANEPWRWRDMNITLAMSHLACPDEPTHLLNRQQLRRFKDSIGRLALPKSVRFSLASSSGIFLGRAYHFDLVRPGAGLFGLAPVIGRPNPLRPVIRLQSKVLQTRRVDAGLTVGYGATHRFARPARLATIAVGYADGFSRALSNRGGAYIAGRLAPIVGRVSMDLVTLDISDFSEDEIRPGDLVDLIGSDQSVDAIAREAGTIGYEVLTSLGRRYQRRYLNHSE
ncbi:MAG: alanine racemase [Dongiaceae bacterium]